MNDRILMKDVAEVQRLTQKSRGWMTAFDFIRGRKRHYLSAVEYESIKGLLVDLSGFCRANETTVGPTNELTWALLGRREVWLRIQQHLNLSPEQLTDLYYGPDKETSA